jgi:predicted metal-binding membrane protein
VLLALAAVAWWSTVVRMADMDDGPGTEPGGLGWFAVTWAVMMAAMMLPSLAPTAAAYAAPARRSGYSRTLQFAAGYLLVWAVAGIGAYSLFDAGRRVLGGALAWNTGGQAAATGVLALAALYEVTPLKRTCLAACRESPRTRERRRGGALASGIRAGGWCVGCSWALMAALFALGVMSLTWMALVASLVALQKLSRRPLVARAATTGVLVALAAGMLVAPDDVPGLVVPGAHDAMHAMPTMESTTDLHGSGLPAGPAALAR